MNREKILFVVVLGIVLLWGGLSLSGSYEVRSVPPGGMQPADPPAAVSHSALPEGERLVQLLAGVRRLDKTHAETASRTIVVPHSDLLPVEAAQLDLPRALPTPWIGIPVEPFPPVTYFRRLREDFIPPVAAKPAEEPDESGGALEEDPAPDLPTVEGILGGGQTFEFREEEWDVLSIGHGIKWYGRVTLTKESSKAGKTKYDLLLPENNQIEFFFEQLDKVKGRMISSAETTIEKSSIESIKFSDTIENQYWTRRTVDRVRKADEIGLCDLADGILELAEDEKYDRRQGLGFARDTYQQALDDKPGYLRAVLGLGEAYHRRFEFDEELGLYQDTMAGREPPELLSRQARIYRKLRLDDLCVKALGRAIFHVPGNVSYRMERGESYYRLGKLDEALADFSEAEKIATAEEKVKAREGRARTLIAMARPDEAVALLSGVTDADSLVTLGAAYYAQMKWTEALDAFQSAASLEPDNTRAMTNLGIARARTATDWEGIELAVEILTNARAMNPLNYFFPPIGLGFAEQRRGDLTDEARKEYFTTSIEHYKTAVDALPGDAFAHYVLGRSYLRDGNYEGARKEFRTAFFLDYRLSDALLGAGTANMALGEWKLARAILDRFSTVENRVRENSKDANEVRVATLGAILAHYRLGRAWLMSDDISEEIRLEQAEKQFRAVLALDSRHVPSLNALGYILYNLEDVNGSLDFFDKADRLTKEGDPDSGYRKGAVDQIEDTRGRRRWVDAFGRPSSTTIGNAWIQSPKAGVPLSPRLSNGKAVVEGRWERGTGSVWLYHGDPTARKAAQDILNLKFIRARAVLNIRKSDRVATQFLLFFQPRGQATIKVAVGIERDARGEVVLIHRKTSDKKWTRNFATDAAGENRTWPDGDVTVEIVRRDHEKGRFELLMDGVSLGMVELSHKRNRSSLSVGFMWKGASGDSFKTEIDEVELEIYEQ